MAAIVSIIDIARTPEDVYAYATDPRCFSQWQRDVVRVIVPGDDPLRVGDRFETVRRISGAERSIHQEVTEVNRPVSWSARGVEGPIRPLASIAIEPLDGGRASRVTFSLDYEGHGIGVPLLPLVRQQTRRGAPVSYQNLKRLLESA